MFKNITWYLFSVLCLLSFIKMDETKLAGKVVGGEYAHIRAYPHAVYLEIITPHYPAVICGSSVINQYFLLTVAHCFEGFGRQSHIKAYAGHENINKAKVLRRVSRTITHEHYDPVSTANDIALTLLEKPMPLGSNIKRIIIKRRFPRKVPASIAGWGVVDEQTAEETILLKSVRQKVKPPRQCLKLGVKPGMMCAGSSENSAPRPAPGDSGSGLITRRHELIGLLSFKLVRYPALPVYTNVSFYYRWIKSRAERYICSKKI